MQAPVLILLIGAVFTATISRCTAEWNDGFLECSIKSFVKFEFVKEDDSRKSQEYETVKKDLAVELRKFAGENADNAEKKGEVAFAKYAAHYWETMTLSTEDDEGLEDVLNEVERDIYNCLFPSATA